MSQLLTINEVATRCQLHPQTVRSYIIEGAQVGVGRVKLKASKFGRYYRVKLEDLDKFLNAISKIN
jgi:excisionase family DNA binding protein